MRFAFSLALVLALAAVSARAEPAVPERSAALATLSWGVFCAQIEMGRAPAPGTESGWLHVPDRDLGFHWPDRQVVPAVIGLAFGVKALGAPGVYAPAEIRVQRPDRTAPEVWQSDLTDVTETFNFFRFDRPDELATGLWSFEAWDGDVRLYRVEFQIVPAAALPEIADSCGAIS